MLPVRSASRSRRWFDFARIMSPYVNHSKNACMRMLHARCTQAARGARKGSCIQRRTERDCTIPEALHSLQRTVARSTTTTTRTMRTTTKCNEGGAGCLRFICPENKRRGNRHGRPCPPRLSNCIVPTRSPGSRKNEQGKSRAKVPGAARTHY